MTAAPECSKYRGPRERSRSEWRRLYIFHILHISHSRSAPILLRKLGSGSRDHGVTGLRADLSTFDSLILTAMTCFLCRMISTSSSHSSTSLASCMAVFTCRGATWRCSQTGGGVSVQAGSPRQPPSFLSRVVSMMVEIMIG